MTDSLPFFTRLWLAWVCWLRVLFDGAFAARVWRARRPEPQAPSATALAPDHTSALVLLAVLQREGRLVDFLQQDVAGFSDAEVGAVARVVHTGCRAALGRHLSIVSIRSEPEQTTVTLPLQFDASQIKLIGNVQGPGPHRGLLRHRGWRVERIELPVPVPGHDPRVLAPAEVEL